MSSTSTAVSPPVQGRTRERRRGPRLVANGQLRVLLISIDLRADVRDIGRGGFSLEADHPVAVGTKHAVKFFLRDGRSFLMSATALHSRRLARPGQKTCHVTGFEFVNGGGGAIAPVIDQLLAALAPAKSLSSRT